MSHHLNDLLEGLRTQVARMTTLVLQAVEQACEALFTADAKLAQETIVMDQRIDEEEVRVEKSAIDVLALQQPAAVDLRTVATIIKVNADFERIADCAVNIAQRVLPLSQLPNYEPPSDLKLIANTVLLTLRDTIKAFNLQDEDLAHRVLKSDDVVDALYHQIVQDTICLMETGGQEANVELGNIMIAKNLERIADHCTNIAEDVIYIHTGRIIRHLRAV
ncbi:MAG TPA: phosphate signaling complex protein PhoU [Tepidisphaeraceae bacterium]|jgi:phosphate transport system protein|nr:phosphate signaling complex protein PhoU [Tepidisphaeraceae bacterium]